MGKLLTSHVLYDWIGQLELIRAQMVYRPSRRDVEWVKRAIDALSEEVLEAYLDRIHEETRG